MAQRINVYIDGFNFYYGLRSKRWRKFYWLDIVAFFELFMKDNQVLNMVYYCTAKPKDNGKKHRQDLFFTANKLNPKFEIIFGKFLEKEVRYGGNTYYTFEEKQTDVNIAVNLIRNVVLNNCDASIVVSGDSDLSPAFNLVKEIKPAHGIISHFPPMRQSVTLSQHADAVIHLERYEKRFAKCILPNDVEINENLTISKPVNWV